MRLGPIAVPVAIAAALFVIVAAEAGWFDATTPEPSFIRADRTAHRVAAAEAPAATPRAAIQRAPVAPDLETPTLGRSVSQTPAPMNTERGSGGASLDADGVATAGPAEQIRQAREEAAKAKQDVVDVTRASLDAQHASEAEFARQKTELDDRAAGLAAELEKARADIDALKLGAAAKAGIVDGGDLQGRAERAEVATRAMTASLAASRDTAVRLRAALAGSRSEIARRSAAAAVAGSAASNAIAAREAALKARSDDLARTDDLLSAERHRTETLTADLAAARGSAAGLRSAYAVAQGGLSALRAAATWSAGQNADLERELADVRSRLVAQSDATRSASDAATAKVAAAHTALAASQGVVNELQGKLAALNAEVATGRSVIAPKPAAFEPIGRSPESTDAVSRLKDDLDGARRGETTLRKENSMLQRQLAEAQAKGKMLGERLAALEIGAGPTKAEPPVPRRARRERTSSSFAEHRRLVDRLGALQRKQMQGEIDAIKREARGLGRTRPSYPEVQGARIVTVKPLSRALVPLRGRDRPPTRWRDDADAGLDTPAGFLTHGSPGDRRGDDGSAIATARVMIRNGQLDQARSLLSRHGGSAATRALADTYNPLTNTEYGALGVDSDADKAAYLYEQAGRSAARER